MGGSADPFWTCCLAGVQQDSMEMDGTYCSDSQTKYNATNKTYKQVANRWDRDDDSIPDSKKQYTTVKKHKKVVNHCTGET